jgi:acetyl esterase
MRADDPIPAPRPVWPAILACLVVAAASLLVASPAGAQSNGGLGFQADVPYGTASGQTLLLDVYQPPGEGPFPGLITVHGGGFVKGDKSLQRGVSRFFAASGYVVFAINYRLAPRFPYPAAVDDAATSVAFVREHAAQYHVDPNRIGIMGSSAGGTIAASVGARSTPPYTTGSDVSAVATWSGALDFNLVLQERIHNQDVLEGVPSYAGMPSASPTSAALAATLARISPINQVKKGSPPFFVANSKVELIPIDQAQDMVAKLQSLKIPVSTLYPAEGHALRYTAQAEEPTVSFLDRYVRDYKGGAGATPTPTHTATPAPTLPPVVEPVQPASRSSSPLLPIVIAIGVTVVVGLVAGSFMAGRRRNRSFRY